MAVIYGFYDSINGDRTYNAEEFSKFFDGIIKDGLLRGVGECFPVNPGFGRTVRVGTGRAWFNHTWTCIDKESVVLTLPDSDPTFDYWISIIIKIDRDARENSITYKAGVASRYPTKPTMIHNASIDEYRLADIFIPAGSTSVSVEDITLTRGTAETPYAVLDDMNVDYRDLDYKPMINGIVLEGDKTTPNLNISYNDTKNRPKINGVTVEGDKPASEYGLDDFLPLAGGTMRGAINRDIRDWETVDKDYLSVTYLDDEDREYTDVVRLRRMGWDAPNSPPVMPYLEFYTVGALLNESAKIIGSAMRSGPPKWDATWYSLHSCHSGYYTADGSNNRFISMGVLPHFLFIFAKDSFPAYDQGKTANAVAFMYNSGWKPIILNQSPASTDSMLEIWSGLNRTRWINGTGGSPNRYGIELSNEGSYNWANTNGVTYYWLAFGD